MNPSGHVTVAMVGKYVELHDAYMSVKESLIHAGIYHDVAVELEWVHSEALERQGTESLLAGVQGIVVPGGFGERGIEGKIDAARFARTRRVPYLGLCLGLQVMVVEAARAAFQSNAPNSTEFDPETPYPVISLLTEQQGVRDKGGTMRLGSYPCRLVPGTRAYAAYGEEVVSERHRHRYEFNNRFREDLARVGLVPSGLSPDGELVEICEIRDHPFMLGTQFHPEFRSRPDRPHPLFRDFLAAAITTGPGGTAEPAMEGVVGTPAGGVAGEGSLLA
jgi:CTP synthase